MPLSTTLKNMNTEEVRAASKAIAKKLVRNIVVGVVISVAITVISNAIVTRVLPSEETN